MIPALWMNHEVCIHILLLAAYSKLAVPSLVRFAIFSLLLSWESQCWDRFAFQLISKLRGPIAGTFGHLQLLLNW